MTAKARIVGRAAAVTLLLAAASIQPARAYSLEGPIWANKKTNFYYAVSGQPSWAFSTALRQALIDWNQQSAFKWVGVQKVANPCASSGPNGAALRATACGQAFGSGVLGITMYSYDGANRFIHAGTVFNAHVNFSIYDGALRQSPDFRRVALHEMGHALGLGHENNANIPAIMQPFISNAYKPTSDDIAGIRALYGPPG
jgi:hypothetical protein